MCEASIVFFATVVFVTILFFGCHTINEANKKRYAPILHKLVPGRKYPYWRLEEMLEEELKNDSRG